MADIFMKTLDIGDGNKYRMLPNVTSEDEGKVLIVTNGEWGADYIVEPFTNTCLSFLGNEEFTLKTNNTSKNWDGVLTYSTDGDTWTEWDGTEISSANKALYLRGSGNTKITGGLDERFAFAGTAELKVECEGRIDNLLDFETVKNGDEPSMSSGCYYSMFYNCTSLTTAPELPATTLASQCYRAMFQGCTSLVSAPELLATTLAASCYQNMFYNCTSLTTAPELPATTLATSCYYNMFNRSGLTVPPNILPATELHDSCYRFMFEFTAIDSIPKIMGTSYATDCFKGMFDDCKQLIVSSASGQDWTYGWTAPAATYTTGMFGSDDGESTWAQLDTANFPNSGTPTEGTTYYFKAAPETINFLYNGTQLQAKNGVSWRQWLESDYNTIGVDVNFFDYGRLVFVGVGGVGVEVKSSDIIISNGEYVPI